MATPLRLLVLEDNVRDADLLIEHLRAEGYEPTWQRVDTEEAYRAGLDHQPDIVLADYSQPSFNASLALQILKAGQLDIPFIVVSGCIGEDVAVRCMKEGADDYLLKDRLARLGQAVTQAIDRKRLREETRQAQERLYHETSHDMLTGLPNRTLFLDRLERVIERWKRDNSSVFSLFLVSLDGFNAINDGLGHKAGDQVLIDVSRRLTEHVRSGDTVARLAGDEFAVLLDNIKSETNVPHVAQRIQRSFSKPFIADGRDVFITLSMGITTGMTKHATAENLLRDAAIAMDRAKEAGKSSFILFDPVMHKDAIRRLKIEAELRHALDREEFRLFYHPVVSLPTGRLAGFEALVRWAHPEEGILPPNLYLPVAESIGLDIAIGEWVLREACHQMSDWLRRFPQETGLSIAVNISARHFADGKLLDTVAALLIDAAIPPSALKIELTESAMMERAEQATAAVHTLKSYGVLTCLDDFGTGYSSLSYLQRFPADFLKIDRSFISRMEQDPKSLEIVKTIIQLAHQLGRMVIAEGLETAFQLTQLRELRCEFGQGYYFAEPLTAQDAASIIAQERRW